MPIYTNKTGFLKHLQKSQQGDNIVAYFLIPDGNFSSQIQTVYRKLFDIGNLLVIKTRSGSLQALCLSSQAIQSIGVEQSNRFFLLSGYQSQLVLSTTQIRSLFSQTNTIGFPNETLYGVYRVSKNVNVIFLTEDIMEKPHKIFDKIKTRFEKHNILYGLQRIVFQFIILSTTGTSSSYYLQQLEHVFSIDPIYFKQQRNFRDQIYSFAEMFSDYEYELEESQRAFDQINQQKNVSRVMLTFNFRTQNLHKFIYGVINN